VTVTVKCLTCKNPFQARLADRKRGWARFCSKRCKAIRQTKLTGVSGPITYVGRRNDWDFDGSWDAHEVP